MVMVRVSETYDLSTIVDKLTVLGIHTPDTQLIAKQWRGFFMNYRFFKVVGCDVTMACASMLPADPLQIGTEAGDVAPQDMFNPILYGAVSNESYNTLVNRIRCSSSELNNFSIGTGSIAESQVPTTSPAISDFDIYYSLLAESDGWKKAMPQSGLKMEGLYPIVFPVLKTIGNQVQPTQVFPTQDKYLGYDNAINSLNPGYDDVTLKGPGQRMPRLPTIVGGSNWQYIAPASDLPNEVSAELYNIPKTFVGALILPPAKLNVLYYRLKVTWTIEFMEPRSVVEYMNWNGYQALAQMSYYNQYYEPDSKLEGTKSLDSVDATGANVEKIMESTK